MSNQKNLITKNLVSKNLGNDKTMIQFYPKKEECFDSILDADVYVSKDIAPNKSFKEFTGMSWDELEDYTQENNHLYEIIREECPRYSYFDIDATYQKVKHAIKEGEDFGTKITEKLKIMIEDFKADNDIEEECDLVILEASTKNKYSYHFIDRSISFKDKNDSQVYHDKFIDHLYNNNETLLSTVIDKCVYDKDRNFRLINQSKMNTGAQILKLTSNHKHTDTFITNVPEDAKHYKIPKKWLKKKREYIEPIVEEIEDDEFDELLMLIDKLSDARFDEYNSWLNTVWCLHACGLCTDLIHSYSEERCPQKYDYNSTESVLKQYDHTKSKFSIETLKAWVFKDCGYEIERHVERVKKEQPINKEDHYQFINLLKQYDGWRFPQGNGLNEFIKKVSCCVSMILNSSTTFCMYSDSENQYDLTKEIPELHFSITTLIETAKGPVEEVKNWTLQTYMIKHPLKFPIYNKIVFKPNDIGLSKNQLNTWAGFKAQLVHNVDMGIVNVFINHIRDVWANGNQEHYKYIMSWIAQVIKHPEKKTDVAVLLQGGQGTGKTLPCDILLERVFGRNIGMSASGLGILTQKFNGSTMSKIFCKVDELSIVGADSFSCTFDKMKSLITDRHIQIERKGMEHIMIDNHINFIMTTNHRHTVKIEADDRRYACFEVGEKYKQNTDYFEDFMKTLDNDEAGNHIFTYFKNYPNDEMVNLRKIPITNIKEEMLELSKSSVVRFVECMDEELDEALLYDWIGKDGQRAVSVDNFYTLFLNWCAKNGEKGSWAKNKISIELKNKGLLKNTGRNERNKELKRYYQFN